MSEVHSRSDNLKMALDYQDWELLSAVCHTIAKGLRRKGVEYAKTAQSTDKLGLLVDDILAAQRSEGHV